ncbi:hypothetical protein OSB04_004727 [Centaurea solstitialis]|uniref:Pentatricopeptide repeat-containing protein n=1 Tax=Centaurea solstitialis TaxID=347529 RepID=A0AA38WFQ7_9ASTR|nr:hypothetical protein OSB04_004727 [Centaurea solstitialis]
MPSITLSSLSSILRRCTHLTVFPHAKQTHVQILINGLNHDLTLQTDLLLAYSKSSLLYARKVFDEMPERKNMHSWNIMISSYVQNSMPREALTVFDRFLDSGLKPDHYTLPPVFKICGGIGDFSLGLTLHGLVVKLGFENCVVVGTSVLDFYSKCGRLDDSWAVFVGLEWKDPAVWNSMVCGLAKAGLHREAFDCFREMLENEPRLDPMTVPSLLSVCGKSGDVTRGKEIHGKVVKNTVLHKDAAVGNSLIDMYSKCGCLHDAENVFRGLKTRNLVTWTTLISCYGFHGNGIESLRSFEKMKISGFKPNKVTLTAVLAGCSHSGLIEQAKKIFGSIRSRFGLFNEALGLVQNMKTVPPASVWGALLAGSLVHRNVKIGETAARRLFEIEPENVSNYVALCGIYDSRGMWSDASRVRSEMRRSGVGKTPGISSVSIGGQIRNFYQGNFNCSFGKESDERLKGIIRTLLLVHSEIHIEF